VAKARDLRKVGWGRAGRPLGRVAAAAAGQRQATVYGLGHPELATKGAAMVPDFNEKVM